MSAKMLGINPEKRHILLWAGVLALAGILLLIVAHFVFSLPFLKEYASAELGKSFYHLLELISHALIVAAIFSVFIEFKDFTEYVSNILQRQLRDHQYIQTLSPEELQNLKRDVDATILGVSDKLEAKDHFYEFVADGFERILKMPYRRNMYEQSTFSVVDKRPELFRRTTILTYTFVKGFSQAQPITISWDERLANVVDWETTFPIESLEVALDIKSKGRKLVLSFLQKQKPANQNFF